MRNLHGSATVTCLLSLLPSDHVVSLCMRQAIHNSSASGPCETDGGGGQCVGGCEGHLAVDELFLHWAQSNPLCFNALKKCFVSEN